VTTITNTPSASYTFTPFAKPTELKQIITTSTNNNDSKITMGVIISIIFIMLAAIIVLTIIAKNRVQSNINLNVNSPLWTVHENPIRRDNLNQINV
jgi:hypothetical protein